MVGVVALWRREPVVPLLVGVGWTVFGIVHLSYHLHHLGGLAPIDVIGNVAALGGTLMLALYLLVLGLEEVRAGPTIPR